MSKRPAGAGLPSGGRLLARNAYINFLGQAAPIPVAVLVIPPLINALGTERFGVLALAWVVTSYFGFFDFGLGRATTKFVAEYRARGEIDELPGLVWTSLGFHVVLGTIGGALLASLAPWLTERALNIPSGLLAETKSSFYLLAMAVPLIVTVAALRGVLEALQRFDMVNAVKVPASIANYLGPLLVLPFADSLTAVVGVLVIVRGVVLLAYLLLCLRALPVLARGLRFDFGRLKPLIGFGGWLTISNFVGPSVLFIDRFMIGAFVSLSAVTFYTTPYEVISKLTIFPISLLAVVFPALSALTVERAHELRALYLRSSHCLLVLVAPIVGVLLALSQDLLGLWVGPEFARESASIAKLLAVGILFNVLSQVPAVTLQGLGRADLSAKLHLVQMPFYVITVWYLAKFMGVTGVAVAWALRAAAEAAMFYVAAGRVLPPPKDAAVRFTRSTNAIVSIFLLAFLGLGTLPSLALLPKAALVVSLFGLFVLWEWRYFLDSSEREVFVGGLGSLLRRTKSAA